MSRDHIGILLRDNVKAGRPSRIKSYSDYTGLPVEPCGEYAPDPASIEVPPWMPAQGNLGAFQRLSLHREIEHFMAYMKPTARETLLRQDLISRFTELVSRLEPDLSVRPVGSTVSGLHFPSSDIDMVLTLEQCNATTQSYGTSTVSRLSALEFKIRSSGFASKIESILHASIPLLRITDATTGLDVDLTAADDHGIRATKMVRRWIETENGSLIKSLVMVLKLFLSTRRLGFTYTGGVNSYMLVWMVVAWVELELPRLIPGRSWTKQRDADIGDILVSRMNSITVGPSSRPLDHHHTEPPKRSEEVDLGFALKAFLKFYGEDFDATTATIRFSSRSVTYGVKSHIFSSYGTRRYLLSITDPADPSIDLGAKAYAIKHVQESFKQAYQLLVSLETGSASRSSLVKARMQGTLGCLLGGQYSKLSSRRERIVTRWRKASK